MALETLEMVHEINGVGVRHNYGAEATNVDPAYIDVNHDKNQITFTIQKGPIKEGGVNGCQIDEMLHVVRRIIAGLNKAFPCRENSCAITKIDEALMWLRERTRERESRGVEGKNKE